MAHHDASNNNPVKELLSSLVGIALLLVVIAGIAIFAWLRPAGNHEPAAQSATEAGRALDAFNAAQQAQTTPGADTAGQVAESPATESPATESQATAQSDNSAQATSAETTQEATQTVTAQTQSTSSDASASTTDAAEADTKTDDKATDSKIDNK